MTSDSSRASPKKKFTITAFNAAISAEHRRIGYVSLTHRLPPKTIPEGKVVVHIFPRSVNKAWAQFPTDDIEPCDCGSPLFGPVHYREKEGIKRESNALFSNSSSVRKRVTRRCSFKGCSKTSERPFADGWADLAGWGPGVPDGMYCREHTEAIERGDLQRAGLRRKRDGPPNR